MDWLSRLLVGVLVVAGISVALASDCQSDGAVARDGGSCSEARIGPAMPLITTSHADIPVVRVELLAVMAGVSPLIAHVIHAVFSPTDARTARGSPKPPALCMRD